MEVQGKEVYFGFLWKFVDLGADWKKWSMLWLNLKMELLKIGMTVEKIVEICKNSRN